MGRTTPSLGRPPAALRRDARAKKARATLNKVIPALLTAHPCARRGIEQAELIIDPPPLPPSLRVTQEVTGDNVGDSGAGRDDFRENRERGGRSKAKAKGKGDREQQKHPRISLRVTDTLSAAHSLLYRSHSQSNLNLDLSNVHPRVAILNMASALNPGGGYLSGASTGQEEYLCGHTTLLPSLRDEFYRLPELGVVYTPDVLVFRSNNPTTTIPSSPSSATPPLPTAPQTNVSYAALRDETEDLLPKRDRWFVSCATAAMLRLPELEDGNGEQQRYASARDRDMAERKMCAVMRVFQSKGCRRVVLGAWGCGGGQGSPVGEVAGAWRRVLLGGNNSHSRNQYEADNHGERRRSKKKSGGSKGGTERSSRGEEADGETWCPIEEIVFAIPDARLAGRFARAFGEADLVLEESDDENRRRDSDPDPNNSIRTGEEGEEDGDVKELRSRIRELEAQVAQARSPHLRAGLGAVLEGLRRQVPEVEGEGCGEEC
ncbi:hypothetical protein F4810DRAFT_640389 [Camillea tinctor]|nr:hypothetical protein F4810DRAFT_640389 [Camillea tinctor]